MELSSLLPIISMLSHFMWKDISITHIKLIMGTCHVSQEPEFTAPSGRIQTERMIKAIVKKGIFFPLQKQRKIFRPFHQLFQGQPCSHIYKTILYSSQCINTDLKSLQQYLQVCSMEQFCDTLDILFFFFFGLFRAASMAYGSSQARGQIGAVAAGLHTTRSNARSSTY